MENTITGFRPIRSATFPQKIAEIALPIMYEEATFENKSIEVRVLCTYIYIFFWDKSTYIYIYIYTS
jgi:hypothetical protein